MKSEKFKNKKNKSISLTIKSSSGNNWNNDESN